MKPYHKNPRQITKRQMDDLGAWLSELGDLSGIVHDLNTDEIIGGNQRGRVFNVNECEVELTDGPHEPDEQGTVAHGFIIWKGNRYAYRQVRWTEKQAEKANIVANKSGGEWDFDTLANEFDAGELIEWGFDEWELGLHDAGSTPNIDDLANEYGDPGERDFWPFIRVQVAPETFQRWQSFIRSLPGEDEAHKAAQILEAVDVTVLGSV